MDQRSLTTHSRKKGGRRAPKPAQSYFKNDKNDEDNDDDDDETMSYKKPSKKDADDSSDDEALEGENVNEKSKREQADRSRFFQANAALAKQGIDLEVDNDNVDGEEDGYQEYLAAQAAEKTKAAQTAAGEEEGGSKSSFTKEQMHAVFGKKADEKFESFTMGEAAGRGYGSVIGDRGQVKVAVDKRDAWLVELDEQEGGKEKKDEDARMTRIFSNRAPKKAAVAEADATRKSNNPLECRKVLVEHMKEGENVLRALRRLGGNKQDDKQRGRNRQQRKRTKPKKSGEDNTAASEESKNTEENKAAFLEVTEAANTLLNQGTFGIYQQNVGDIEVWVQRAERKIQARKEAAERAAAEKLAREEAAKAAEEKAKADAAAAGAKGLTWEYKWSAEEEEVHGPFEGEEMNEWRNDGYFDEDVVARQAGTKEWIKAQGVLSFVDTRPNKKRKTDFAF